MRFFAVTTLLLAVIALATAKKTVIKGSASFLASVPELCITYLEKLIKWEIIVTSKKEIDWIISWTNTTTCQVCLSNDLTAKDLMPCMECLEPHEHHIIKLPGCKECFKDKGEKRCSVCLAEVVYVTESVICAVEAKVKKTMTLLHLGM
ncbi:unnamed protein product [Dibothriocephalus latus]|uniref:Uncharacterized protein n=1 Tax=Dibothriocephalus latus TaxID=60516 RepID=A0A3P6TRR8_DIBLA|nr:unnamed protein product [Dibothriocephalus latus]